MAEFQYHRPQIFEFLDLVPQKVLPVLPTDKTRPSLRKATFITDLFNNFHLMCDNYNRNIHLFVDF